ncbi:hypothetical protein OS493_033265 [Desmophyllum pertusum]|uniref:Uncharacterized protein n=1 Tax=Desmophyllum pertusum TaxID=174260 RepID=A0A9W9ZL15_9CNID|nr:hypothetical protein OS493_033265 [Desmophyllum pertusum]
MSDKEKPSKDLKKTSRDSDGSLAPVDRGSNNSNLAGNLDDQTAPIPRAASVSKPTPKPRPRSLIVEKDTSNKEPKVVETAEKPVAPPRIKSKPFRGDSEIGAQENRSTKALNQNYLIDRI